MAIGTISVAAHLFGSDVSRVDALRWAGLLFQLAGLGSVVVGLNRSRQLFERKPVWHDVIRWLQGWRDVFFPRATEPTHHVMKVEAGSIGIGFGDARLKRGAKTIKGRVSELEKEVNILFKRLTILKTEVTNDKRSAKQSLERLAAERQAGDDELDVKLANAVIGGIHVEIWGLAYLAIGICLATIPLSKLSAPEHTGLLPVVAASERQSPIMTPLNLRRRHRQAWPAF